MMPASLLVTNPADNGNTGTLRWAVEQANSATSPSTIDFDLGSSPQTITLAEGQLELSNTAYPTTIDGPGESQLSISGHNASRVFQIDAGVTATISGLTITAGFSTGNGGGVLVAGGNLLMSEVAVTNNEAVGSQGHIVSSGKIGGAGGDARGGGVAVTAGNLTLQDDRIEANVARGGTGGYDGGVPPGHGGVGGAGQGGGLYIGGGSVSIADTIFNQDRAVGGFGGPGGQGENSGAGATGGVGGSGSGGAVYMGGGNVHATGVSAQANEATGGGGGTGGHGGTGAQGSTGKLGSQGLTGGPGGPGGTGGNGGNGGTGGAGGTGHGGGRRGASLAAAGMSVLAGSWAITGPIPLNVNHAVVNDGASSTGSTTCRS